MSMLSRVQTTVPLSPPRLVIHSLGGVGKTKFGYSIPGRVFVPAEEGFGDIRDVPHFPKPQDYGDVMAIIEDLLKGQHEFRACVFDTMDHIEPLIWAEVCRVKSEPRKPITHIEGFGYGKGYLYADPLWTELFQGLDAIRRERGMTVCVLCHNEIKTIDDPVIGPYDRIEPKLHKRANALMYDWADVVGYLSIEKTALEREGAKGRTITTAQVTGRRILELEDRGGFKAKNRYGLPPKITIPEAAPYDALRTEIVARLQPQPKETE